MSPFTVTTRTVTKARVDRRTAAKECSGKGHASVGGLTSASRAQAQPEDPGMTSVWRRSKMLRTLVPGERQQGG
jgi:hypothetical protein